MGRADSGIAIADSGTAMDEAAASTASDEQRWAIIHATKDKHCAALLAKPGVNYVGVSMKKTAGKDTGIPGIVVAVQNKLPLPELTDNEVVPPLLDGVATDVVEDALHVRKIAGPGKEAKKAKKEKKVVEVAAKKAVAKAAVKAAQKAAEMETSGKVVQKAAPKAGRKAVVMEGSKQAKKAKKAK